MASITLERKPMFDADMNSINGHLIEEALELCIVSIAIPVGEHAAFSDAFNKAFDTLPPKVGQICTSSDKMIRFLGISPDQMLTLVTGSEQDGIDFIGSQLQYSCYYTRQTDNWCTLRVSGPKVRDALERICPVDLDPRQFSEQQVARTMMEHLTTIIMRDGEQRFLLLSGSSGASCFLHAIETSIRNVS